MVDDISPKPTNEEIEERVPEAGPYRWVVFSAFVAPVRACCLVF